MDLQSKLQQIKSINQNPQFGKWNTTSLAFLYLCLEDINMLSVHHVIQSICTEINSDKVNILNTVNDNSISGNAYQIYDIIVQKLENCVISGA
jgi:hypothetical protein